MDKIHFRFLGILFLLLGIISIFGSFSITGSAIGTADKSSFLGSSIGIIFIYLSIVLFAGGELLEDKLTSGNWRKYQIRCKNEEVGFDNNHVHSVLDLGIRSKLEFAKKIKGFIARKFFRLFLELKKPKHEGGLFWDSGLWSPASYGVTPTSLDFTVNYVRMQKYGSARDQAKQYWLSLFCD